MNVFETNLDWFILLLHYLDLCLKIFLLVLDFFEQFWNMCLEWYWSDPCHYLSRSGLSCDTMLKMAGIKLDLLTDDDM